MYYTELHTSRKTHSPHFSISVPYCLVDKAQVSGLKWNIFNFTYQIRGVGDVVHVHSMIFFPVFYYFLKKFQSGDVNGYYYLCKIVFRDWNNRIKNEQTQQR